MGLPAHISAGFTMGWRYRHELRRLLDTTPTDCCILKLDPELLHNDGIAALALDFDGVLANHGAAVPLAEVTEWMKRCEKVFGGKHIFVLSNKPTEERIRWFAGNFPDFRYISGVRKKPFPDGLIMTAELAGVARSAVLMVDDRLLTGCLAALDAGATPCYISHPYRSFRHLPGSETFFTMLRWLEKIFIRLCSSF